MHESVANVNIPLLMKIQDHILEEPRRMDMWHWLMTRDDMARMNAGDVPPCGTVGCIAGWTVALAAPEDIEERKHYPHGVSADARIHLHLTYDQADKLFYPASWPEAFQDELENASQGTMAYAQIVARRIGHFLDTGE